VHVRRTVLSCLLVVAASAWPGAAHADGPAGAPCVLSAGVNDGYLERVVSGGPVAGTGTLTCTVQVGAATHDGADTASESAAGTGVVVLAPRAVALPTWQDLYICTRFTPTVGAPWYWSADTAGWSTDPGVPCGRDVPWPQPLFDFLDAMCASGLCSFLPQWCPVTAGLAGDYGVLHINYQGDAYLADERLWDCPPYGV
jgi:hypothetical protein